MLFESHLSISNVSQRHLEPRVDFERVKGLIIFIWNIKTIIFLRKIKLMQYVRKK